MATVPGDPNDTGPDPYGGIPPGLRPGYPELLMAAAIHKQQQDQKLAGDVIPFKKPPLDLVGDPKQLDEFNKMMTRDTLSRALGGGAKVLPMTPQKTSMGFEALDPKDEQPEGQQQQEKQKKKKSSEADGEFQVAQAGEPMIPEPIQNVLDAHARGKATASDVRKVLQPTGWSVDLRRGRYEYELFDPTGKQHFHAP